MPLTGSTIELGKMPRLPTEKVQDVNHAIIFCLAKPGKLIIAERFYLQKVVSRVRVGHRDSEKPALFQFGKYAFEERLRRRDKFHDASCNCCIVDKAAILMPWMLLSILLALKTLVK